LRGDERRGEGYFSYLRTRFALLILRGGPEKREKRSAEGKRVLGSLDLIALLGRQIGAFPVPVPSLQSKLITSQMSVRESG